MFVIRYVSWPVLSTFGACSAGLLVNLRGATVEMKLLYFVSASALFGAIYAQTTNITELMTDTPKCAVSRFLAFSYARAGLIIPPAAMCIDRNNNIQLFSHKSRPLSMYIDPISIQPIYLRTAVLRVSGPSS